ncbi:MAG: hypothetical protein IPG20_21130 [Gammaproteobacteria bacterium]|nr:hypothetical protein [Gammaproteobacteria bacterium]
MIQVFDRVLVGTCRDLTMRHHRRDRDAGNPAHLLGYLRGLLLLTAGAMIDRLLGERVISALISNARRGQSRGEYVLGCAMCRSYAIFSSGPSIIALFDLPSGAFSLISRSSSCFTR